MSEMVKYVGLDVHKITIAVAVAEGRQARRGARAWRDRQHAYRLAHPHLDSDKVGGTSTVGEPPLPLTAGPRSDAGF